MKYQVIYADPPWDYRNCVQHGGVKAPYTSSASAFYPTMTVAELCAYPVREYADDPSILFMWTTAPILEDSLEVMAAWDFDYKTIAFVWDKQRVNPGYYTMSQCEYVLVGTRSKIPTPRGARNVRQLVSECRTTHSTKPEEVALRIEKMFPTQRKLELFARREREEWTCVGNEVAIKRLSDAA